MTLRVVAAAKSSPGAGNAPNDGVLVTDCIFAVADGSDEGTGSGQRALSEVVRRLGPAPYPHGHFVRNAFRGAHVALWFDDEGTHTLQSTVTVVVWFGTLVAIGHVGDSRAYLVRGSTVLQLTTDHVTGGPHEGSVTRLGFHQRPPDPEIIRLRIGDGDRIVLCTDGLWRHVTPEHLLESVLLAPHEACNALCAKAPLQDEQASVVVVEFQEPAPAASDEHVDDLVRDEPVFANGGLTDHVT